MKKFECEICGSNDFSKTEMSFVCDHCGCKYSLDEIKNILIDTSTADFDEKTVDNLFALAKNAYDSEDMTEAIKYCDKALELSTKHPSIWVLKGKSEAWSSTFSNIKISKMMNCYRNAYLYLMDNDSTIINEAYTDAKKFFRAIFDTCGDQIKNGIDKETAKICIEAYKNVGDALKTFETDFSIDTSNDYEAIMELGFHGIFNAVVDNYYYIQKHYVCHSPSTPNFSNETYISTTSTSTFLLEELSKLVNRKEEKRKLYNAIIDFNDGCASYNYGPVWGEIGAALKRVSQIYREKVKALENSF